MGPCASDSCAFWISQRGPKRGSKAIERGGSGLFPLPRLGDFFFFFFFLFM